MNVHDWTQIDPGIFRGFHQRWISRIVETLNGGMLPKNHYAEAEQYAEDLVPDVLALHLSEPDSDTSVFYEAETSWNDDSDGGIAVATTTSIEVAVTKPSLKEHVIGTRKRTNRQKLLVLRHTSGHRVVAVVEIVSPANKDRKESVSSFAAKVRMLLARGVHVVVIDLLPPTRSAPQGTHSAVWAAYSKTRPRMPEGKSLSVASYVATTPVEAYFEYLSVGDALPPAPLFLTAARYVELPLADTYRQTVEGTAAYWRKILEQPAVAVQ